MSKIYRAITDAFTSCCYIKSSQWYEINIPILQMKKLRLTELFKTAQVITVWVRICAKAWKVKVKVTQSCPTLCNPMDYTVHGILQARILEWVALPFSRDLPNAGIELGSPALLRPTQFQTSLRVAMTDFSIISIYHGSLKHHKRDPFLKLKWWGFLCFSGNWERSSSNKRSLSAFPNKLLNGRTSRGFIRPLYFKF